MRVAIAGKGGAGKTTIASTMARLLARSGTAVVAVDADTNPNLAAALGIDQLPAGVGFLPADIISRRLGGPALKEHIETVLAQHAVLAPDGVRLLRMGMPAHAEEGCLCSAHAAVRAVLADLGDHGGVTIVDMEASPEHMSRGTARHVDVLLLVTEAYYRSLESVRLLAELARELPIPRVAVIANKIRSPQDAEAVGDFCRRHSLEVVARIPWSAEVMDADVARRPLLEAGGGREVVRAVGQLADRLGEI